MVDRLLPLIPVTNANHSNPSEDNLVGGEGQGNGPKTTTTEIQPSDEREEHDDNISRPSHRRRRHEPSDYSRRVSRRHSISRRRSESSNSGSDSSDEDASPLHSFVCSAKPPRKFKMPQLPSYDDTPDPKGHVQVYKTIMEIQGANDAFLCRVFPTTLSGAAQNWYNNLPRRSIGSFRELSAVFCQQFVASKWRKKSSASLLNLKQQEGESLRTYIKRFNVERLEVEDCGTDMVIAALRHGVRDKDLRKELHLHLPKNVDRLMMIAERHMVAEEDMKAIAPPPKRLGMTEGRRRKEKG